MPQRQELTIRPAAPLYAGEPFTADGNVPRRTEQIISAAAPFPTGWVIFDGGSFVLSEPERGGQTTFPSNDHPLDKALYILSRNRATLPVAATESDP